MATKDQLIADLDYLSTTVGDRSRAIALAIVAIWWAALIQKDGSSILPAQLLIGPVLFSALSVFFDFLQYALSYIFAARNLSKLERSKATEFHYDRSALSYRTRRILFYAKQATMMTGLIWFMAILVPLVVE